MDGTGPRLSRVRSRLSALVALALTCAAGTVAVPASAAAEEVSGSSALVAWNCTGSPCPWGDQSLGHALVWPGAVGALQVRHGYTTSEGVYAPGPAVAGYRVRVVSGSARVYAGTPSGSHRQVLSIGAGATVTLPEVAADEVFSVQADGPFSYVLTPATTPPDDGGDPPDDGGDPTTCTNPTSCDPVSWVPAIWICDNPACQSDDWVGGVITWPSWSAYESNGRSPSTSRTVYTWYGEEKLYPYMGAWADGCQVTVVSGEVLVIEWERGRDSWRETLVRPGETHTIDLVGAENGAMLETPSDPEPFVVSLANCTPQPIDKG